LLHRIQRETHLQVLQPRMLSGHFQGRLLAMLSSMIQPKRILEIGTYTGYSALCLAEGLAPDGRLITLDVNVELEQRVRGYFRASSYAVQIDYRVGDARNIIPTLDELFDLVFIDADKSGKVIHESKDKDTRIMQQFNDRVRADSQLERVLLPIRDGLYLLRKRSV
jgi:predicted O-methyltransferase YrrM